MYLPPVLLSGASGQQRGFHRSRCEIFAYVGEMLLREHLGGRHYAALVAVAYGYQAAEHGHHGLPGTHVALEQAVHLPSAHEVAAYLLDHALLGSGEAVGQGVVAAVEVRPHLVHHEALGAARAYVFLFEQGQLQQEELLVLEPPRRFLELVGVLWEMYVPERRLQRHEPFLSEYVVGQGLPDFRQTERERRGFDTVHDLAGDASVLQFLAARIYSRERRLRHMPVVRDVDFGVDHIYASVELLRLAEEHEHAPGREPAEVPLDALEEY